MKKYFPLIIYLKLFNLLDNCYFYGSDNNGYLLFILVY